ncbi:MAG: type II toxin-antitoxin system RelE/ParE family toxin [Porticoccaceae bacterium]
MNYSFLPAAEAEYLQAVRFFEERQPGLGAALVTEFESVMEPVVARPQTWKIIHPSGIRRIGLQKFPFSVFYRVLADNTPQVTAFAHHRRIPGY